MAYIFCRKCIIIITDASHWFMLPWINRRTLIRFASCSTHRKLGLGQTLLSSCLTLGLRLLGGSKRRDRFGLQNTLVLHGDSYQEYHIIEREESILS